MNTQVNRQTDDDDIGQGRSVVKWEPNEGVLHSVWDMVWVGVPQGGNHGEPGKVTMKR